jgi:hypothetical protein
VTSVSEFVTPEPRTVVLDEAHIGHINGALGTILHGDVAPRIGWLAKLKTLLAIIGPGLIVMVGDNDAGPSAPIPKRAKITARPSCGRSRC